MDEYRSPNDLEPAAPRNKRDGVGRGFLVGIALHATAFPALTLVTGLFDSDAGLMVIVCCGLSQLLYQVPAFFIARSKGYPGIAKGVALVTALTFLLNAGCWGLIAISSGIH